jgi:hypothetical protein
LLTFTAKGSQKTAMTSRLLMTMCKPLRWVLVAALCLLACNAPFIPVPPPENVFVSQLVADGTGNTRTVWVTEGKPDTRASLAKFFIFNNSRGTGVIVDANADGSYVAPAFDGTAGDRVFLSYVTQDGAESETVCRQLVEGDPAPTCSQ